MRILRKPTARLKPLVEVSKSQGFKVSRFRKNHNWEAVSPCLQVLKPRNSET